MSFKNWLKSFLTGEKTVEISTKDIEAFMYKEELKTLSIEEFAIHSAINMIAGAVSKCEFRTFLREKEVQAEEYYLWNYEPNVNQNSTQFIQELVSRLLYANECLVVEASGQLIIAEGFSKQEFALRDTVFSNVSRGTLTFQRPFYMSEVLYFRLNNKNIKVLLSNLCQGYNAIIDKAIQKYEKSGGRKGTLEISSLARGDKQFAETFEKLMNERFRKYFEAENAVLPLFDGYTYNEQPGEQGKKTTGEVSDIKGLTAEIYDRVAQAFRIPPALLKGDIADIEKITDNFLTFCIDPLCDMIAEEITRKRYGYNGFRAGNYADIDTTCIKHIDIFGVAANVDKLIASGMYSIDELRRKLRDTQLGTEHSQKHWITKNYESLEGGETENENVGNQTSDAGKNN